MKKPIQSGGGATSEFRNSVLFDDALADSIAVGTTKLNAIRVMARIMSEMMQEIHGGEWRVKIDHDSRFVFVAERLRDAPISPKPEVM